MSYYSKNPFSATSTSYKNCLIVTEEPRPQSGVYACQGRIVLGGRMNLPLPTGYGGSASEALAAALDTARKTIDRLQSDPQS